MRLLSHVTTLLRWRLLLCAGLFALPGLSMAWDGSVHAPIAEIDVTDGSNLGFRVYLLTAMCGNANTWGYLNNTDSNYNVYVATLLMANAQGFSVTVYSNRDSNGLCHIGYIAIP